MYFVTANTGSPTEVRSAVIEEIVHGTAAELPFARCELGGEPDVLGYYYTQQQFVARVALAV